MRGRIEKALSGFYYVNVGGQVLQCRARGKFRREGTSPLVGDWVQVRELGGGEGFVEELEPRTNCFARPCRQPAPSCRRQYRHAGHHRLGRHTRDGSVSH